MGGCLNFGSVGDRGRRLLWLTRLFRTTLGFNAAVTYRVRKECGI